MNILNYLTYLCVSLVCFFLYACIGDDIVLDEIAEEIRITNPIDSLQVGGEFSLEALFFNNIGDQEERGITWTSSNETILTVSPEGVVMGISAGTAVVMAEVQTSNTSNTAVTDELPIVVTEDETVPNTVTARSGTIQTTSSYILEGSMVLRMSGNGLILEVGDDFRASSALPGLYVYLTNNPNTAMNAVELGEVTQFEGAHFYPVPEDVAIGTYQYALFYCKPFNVKVGDGEFAD